MPRPRRYYAANAVYFATARVAEGLPFIPDEFMNGLILGVLGRSLHLFPVIICDYIFMPNHFHLLFVCKDPQLVQGFFCYLKGEIATILNRLRGRMGPIWQGRTDTPVILDAEKVLETLIYLYTNPQAAGLVESIQEYPGVSSWDAINGKTTSGDHAWIRSSELPKIPRGRDEKTFRAAVYTKLLKDNREKYQISLSPLAWVDCFGESAGMTKDEARNRLVTAVREKEQMLHMDRKGNVIGSRNLANQSIHRSYYPRKYGRRVFCMSSYLELRKVFIEFYRSFVCECREVYMKWKMGITSLPLPLGAFAPPLPLLAVALFTADS